MWKNTNLLNSNLRASSKIKIDATSLSTYAQIGMPHLCECCMCKYTRIYDCSKCTLYMKQCIDDRKWQSQPVLIHFSVVIGEHVHWLRIGKSIYTVKISCQFSIKHDCNGLICRPNYSMCVHTYQNLWPCSEQHLSGTLQSTDEWETSRLLYNRYEYFRSTICNTCIYTW